MVENGRLIPHASYSAVDIELRCTGLKEEGENWQRHAQLTVTTTDSRAAPLQVAVQLDTLLPLLTLQPRELLVAIDGSRSELELQVHKTRHTNDWHSSYVINYAHCMEFDETL